MADGFAQSVKQQADIVRIIGEYVRLTKGGAQSFKGLCPFHKEKTPSFNVQAAQQFYHCFGCGQSGDVFTFVQKIENISFPEAVRTRCAEMRNSAAEAGIFLAGRSAGIEVAIEATGNSRSGVPLF